MRPMCAAAAEARSCAKVSRARSACRRIRAESSSRISDSAARRSKRPCASAMAARSRSACSSSLARPLRGPRRARQINPPPLALTDDALDRASTRNLRQPPLSELRGSAPRGLGKRGRAVAANCARSPSSADFEAARPRAHRGWPRTRCRWSRARLGPRTAGPRGLPQASAAAPASAAQLKHVCITLLQHLHQLVAALALPLCCGLLEQQLEPIADTQKRCAPEASSRSRSRAVLEPDPACLDLGLPLGPGSKI